MSAPSSSATAQSRTTDLDEQLCFALYAATNAITRSYRPMLDPLGITYPQYLVLLVLWHEGSRTNGELAARLQLSPHAVTPLVERLVLAGLAARRRDEVDRRVVHVTLTDAGRELEPKAAEVQRNIVCQLATSDEAFVRLRTDLYRVIHNLTHDDKLTDPSHSAP